MKEEGKVIPHDFQVMVRCSMSDLASIGSGSFTPCVPILSSAGKKGSSSTKQVF